MKLFDGGIILGLILMGLLSHDNYQDMRHSFKSTVQAQEAYIKVLEEEVGIDKPPLKSDYIVDPQDLEKALRVVKPGQTIYVKIPSDNDDMKKLEALRVAVQKMVKDLRKY